MKYTLTYLALLLTSLSLSAQLEVQQSKVGIGTVPSSDAALRIWNPNSAKFALRLDDRSTNSSQSYGLFVETRSSAQRTYAAYTKTYLRGTASNKTAYGQYLFYDIQGGAEVYGIYNTGYGSGKKTGMYTYVGDNYTNSRTNPLLGHHTKIYTKYRSASTAYLAEIHNADTNADKDMYGFRFIKTGNSSGTTYGIHSVVSPNHGYAAHFEGNVVVNGTTINMSDQRTKRDIRDLTRAGDILRQLHPKSYRFEDTDGLGLDTEREQFGFLAQEVEQIAPDLVVDIRQPPRFRNGRAVGRRDSIGQMHSQLETVGPARTLKGIRYMDIIALLVRGYQDHDQLLAGLTSEEPPIGGRASEDNRAVEGAISRSEVAALQADLEAVSATRLEVEALRKTLVQDLEDMQSLRAEAAEVRALRSELEALRAEVALLRRCTDCAGNLPAPATGYNFFLTPPTTTSASAARRVTT